MLTFEPFDLIQTYALNQAYTVLDHVSALVVVAWRALLVDVQRFKSQLRRTPDATIVTSMELARVVAVATDARQILVPFPYNRVKRRLSLFQVLCARLYSLLSFRVLYALFGGFLSLLLSLLESCDHYSALD